MRSIMALIPRAHAFLLLASLLSFLSLFPTSTAGDSNLMLTGDVLCSNCDLSYLDTSFIMEEDCDLALYKDGDLIFNSGTSGVGSTNCTAALNDRGQLIITDPDGQNIWVSSEPYDEGKYVAIMRPDNNVAIYGPVAWSTPAISHARKGGRGPPRDSGGARTAMRNAMFWTEVLTVDEMLETDDYSFGVDEACILALVMDSSDEIIWSSDTAGDGDNCSVSLNEDGQLCIEDGKDTVVWSTDASPRGDGEYVLVLQDNGQAVVYGPMVWSTDTDVAVVHPPAQAVSPSPIS